MRISRPLQMVIDVANEALPVHNLSVYQDRYEVSYDVELELELVGDYADGREWRNRLGETVPATLTYNGHSAELQLVVVAVEAIHPAYYPDVESTLWRVHLRGTRYVRRPTPAPEEDYTVSSYEAASPIVVEDEPRFRSWREWADSGHVDQVIEEHTLDQGAYDYRTDACWRCDDYPATTDVGLCGDCLEVLRTDQEDE